MIDSTVTATFEGKPLDVLNSLIQKREKWLHETYKQSIAATAITAVRSIRALTTTHYGKDTVYIGGITVTRRNDIHPSFSGRSHNRCFRSGVSASRHAPKVDLGRRCVQLIPPSDQAWLNASVYSVNLTKEQLERWPNHPAQFYVIATSQDVVINYVRSKFQKIAQRQSGLAKAVLGAIMGRLSTYPPASEAAGARVAKIVNKFATVVENDSDFSCSVHIESKLMYAVDAVKGGLSGIENAIKSAANKIVGLIKHKAGSRLTEDLSTPFPEVKKR